MATARKVRKTKRAMPAAGRSSNLSFQSVQNRCNFNIT